MAAHEMEWEVKELEWAKKERELVLNEERLRKRLEHLEGPDAQVHHCLEI